MACETTYPVGEGITNLVLTLVNNIGGGTFLLIQMVPNIGKYYLDVLILSQHQAFVSTWVHPWFLVGSVLLIFLVFCVVLCFLLCLSLSCVLCTQMLTVSLDCPFLVVGLLFSLTETTYNRKTLVYDFGTWSSN